MADGLVALPADARTREQFDWIAEQVREANGTAGVWLARPSSDAQERELARSMQAARIAEYQEVEREAMEALALDARQRSRALRTLRSELRRIRRRDFFPPRERDSATAAVEALVEDEVPATRGMSSRPSLSRGRSDRS